MSISIVYAGSIFDSKLGIIACPVNCVGVMGAGLAKEFKERFHESFFDVYSYWCKSGTLRLGVPCIYEATDEEKSKGLKNVVLFPTKHHYTDKTSPEWVTQGIRSLFKSSARHIKYGLAMPALGCGLGGLDFGTFFKIARASIPGDTNVEIYHPKAHLEWGN